MTLKQKLLASAVLWVSLVGLGVTTALSKSPETTVKPQTVSQNKTTKKQIEVTKTDDEEITRIKKSIAPEKTTTPSTSSQATKHTNTRPTVNLQPQTTETLDNNHLVNDNGNAITQRHDNSILQPITSSHQALARQSQSSIPLPKQQQQPHSNFDDDEDDSLDDIDDHDSFDDDNDD